MKNLISVVLLLVPFCALGQVALNTAQIAQKASPSVVVIRGKTDSGVFFGSGFIVSQDGKIVTSLHVIRDMKSASIQLVNGATYDSASVLATDERHDIAILQIASFNLPVLNLGNSDALTIGESLVVVGSPRGLDGTVTAGILSSVRDSGDGYKVLQTDTAINPGNSGGPLLNSKGQAIGVVAFKLRSAEGLNFAIPINYVRAMLNALHEPFSLAQMRQTLSQTAVPKVHTTGASLDDTLNWLKQVIPLGDDPRSIDQPALVDWRNRVWSLDSCTADIGREADVELSRIPSRKTDRFTFVLGDISKCYVEKEGYPSKSYVLWLVTKPNKMFYRFSYGAIDGTNWLIAPESRSTGDLELFFNDKALAERVAAAFLHAADLCRK